MPEMANKMILNYCKYQHSTLYVNLKVLNKWIVVYYQDDETHHISTDVFSLNFHFAIGSIVMYV